jgi:hypothetical protein
MLLLVVALQASTKSNGYKSAVASRLQLSQLNYFPPAEE